MFEQAMICTKAFVCTVLLFVAADLHEAEGAKILALLNLPSPSHYIFNRALLVALAERGHHVTVISASKEKTHIPNLNSIHLENMYEAARGTYDYESFVYLSVWESAIAILDWGSVNCNMELNSTGGQTLLNYPSSEKFDLIITELGWVECFFGFIHKFGSPPVVATSGVGIPPWLSYTLGNPENPSYMPNVLLPYTDHMTFSERLYNFLVHNFLYITYRYYNIPKQEAVAKEYFKEELPPFDEIAKNFSLVLVNTLFGLDNPRPILPNVVPIGGMHINTKPEPLPKDLLKFVNDAKDGFIYFSLGSNLQSRALPQKKLKALLDAFSELKQRVLWKFEDEDLPGLPPNVRIGKWLPQGSILAHPNIRIFITHCGMMSTMEATYWGVPIVGVPFVFDQRVNAKKFIAKGGGVLLDFVTLKKESVLKAVITILDDDSYRQNMKKLSEIFRDQPQSALDRAVFWTEYVIRHGGAPHLRSAAVDLYWHQYLLLDVIAVLIAGVLFVLLIVYVILKTIYRTLKNLLSKKSKTN